MKYLMVLTLLLIFNCSVKTAHFTLTDPIWVEEERIIDIDTIQVRGGEFKVVKYRKIPF